MRVRIIILLLLTICNLLLAQTDTKPYYKIQGEVLDESKKYEPMADVSVLNKTLNKQFTTNEKGQFTVYVHEGDTLRFHKLGYGRKFYYFKSVLGAENYSIQILLNNDTIHMRTFVVKSLSKESENRNLFMNSYIRDSIRMIAYLRKLQAQQNKSNILKFQDLSQSPITFLYDTYSKQARNRRRIERAREIIKEAEKKEDYAR